MQLSRPWWPLETTSSSSMLHGVATARLGSSMSIDSGFFFFCWYFDLLIFIIEYKNNVMIFCMFFFWLIFKKNDVIAFSQFPYGTYKEMYIFLMKFLDTTIASLQRLAPTWDILAKTFEHDKSVTIGKLDCTKYREICTEYEVKGYPTLLWIEEGKKVMEEKHFCIPRLLSSFSSWSLIA